MTCSSNIHAGVGPIVGQHPVRGGLNLRRPGYLSRMAFFEGGLRNLLFFDSVIKCFWILCCDCYACGLKMQKISAVGATCQVSGYFTMSCKRCDFEI